MSPVTTAQEAETLSKAQRRKKVLWLETAEIGKLLRFFDFLCALNVPCHTVRNEFAYF